MLNGYSNYVNQRLVTNLQNDARETINNKIEVLSKQIARLREQYRQERVLTIKKMEKDNAKEALDMAKSLNITFSTTLESLATYA